MSMYEILIALSQYTYFYISKKHYIIHFFPGIQNRRKPSVYHETKSQYETYTLGAWAIQERRECFIFSNYTKVSCKIV